MRKAAMGWSVVLLLAGGSAQAAGPQVVVNDRTHGFTIRYTHESGHAVFAATIPASWDFQVMVDGNQDGKWGYGPFDANSREQPTSDFGYDRDADAQFILCPQYLWAASADDSGSVYASSQCGAYPSAAVVETGGADKNGRVTMRYRIPDSELFGRNATAHLAFRLWDGKAATFYFSPSAPLVLRK